MSSGAGRDPNLPNRAEGERGAHVRYWEATMMSSDRNDGVWSGPECRCGHLARSQVSNKRSLLETTWLSIALAGRRRMEEGSVNI